MPKGNGSDMIAEDILGRIESSMVSRGYVKAKGPGMGTRYLTQKRDEDGNWVDGPSSPKPSRYRSLDKPEDDKPEDQAAEKKLWKDVDSQIDKWDDTFGVETKGTPQKRLRTWLDRLKGVIPGRTHKKLMDLAHDSEKRGLGGEEIADYVLRFQKLALFVSYHQDEIRQVLQGLF